MNNKELHNSYYLRTTVMVTKSLKVKWTRHVQQMGGRRNLKYFSGNVKTTTRDTVLHRRILLKGS